MLQAKSERTSWKLIPLLSIIILTFVSPPSCPGTVLTSEIDPPYDIPPIVVPYFFVSYGVKTYIHELGHVIFALLAGANEAYISEWNWFSGRASWHFPPPVHKWQKITAQSGGLILTRIVAEYTNRVSTVNSLPDYLSQPLGTFYVVNRFDFPNYLIKSSIDRFLLNNTPPGDDLYNIAFEISDLFLPPFGTPEQRRQKREKIINVIYLSWFGLCAIDLWLDWPEINHNLSSIFSPGANSEKPANPNDLHLQLTPLSLQLEYNF